MSMTWFGFIAVVSPSKTGSDYREFEKGRSDCIEAVATPLTNANARGLMNWGAFEYATPIDGLIR